MAKMLTVSKEDCPVLTLQWLHETVWLAYLYSKVVILSLWEKRDSAVCLCLFFLFTVFPLHATFHFLASSLPNNYDSTNLSFLSFPSYRYERLFSDTWPPFCSHYNPQDCPSSYMKPYLHKKSLLSSQRVDGLSFGAVQMTT